MALMVGEDVRRVFEDLSFYKGRVRVRYDDLAHQYFRVADGDSLVLLDGATNVVHVVDKSQALIGWAVKKGAEKMIAIMPKHTSEGGRILVDAIPLADFEVLVHEAKGAHKEHLDDAADLGKQAHAYIEAQIKFEMGRISTMPAMPQDDRVLSCIEAAFEWMDRHHVIWRATERKVMSRELDACGTLDGIAYVSSCDNPFCCRHKFEHETALVDWKSANGLYTTFLYQTAFYVHAVVEEFPSLDFKHRFIVKLGKEDGSFASWHCEVEDQEHDYNGFLFCLELTRNLRVAKDRMDAREDEQKAYEKLMKAEARKAEKLKDCGKKDYKGIRGAKPKCVDGEPCAKCLSLWLTNHTEAGTVSE
jgi:hypothetical protein